MKSNEVIRMGIAGIILTSGLTGSLVYQSVIPKSAYSMDLNGDSINDMVIKSHGTSKYIFLGQSDGTYKRLDDLVEEQKSEIIKQADEKIKYLDNKDK